MDSEAQNDPLFPIAVLIDELKVARSPALYLQHGSTKLSISK